MAAAGPIYEKLEAFEITQRSDPDDHRICSDFDGGRDVGAPRMFGEHELGALPRRHPLTGRIAVPLRVVLCITPDDRLPVHATESLRRQEVCRDFWIGKLVARRRVWRCVSHDLRRRYLGTERGTDARTP